MTKIKFSRLNDEAKLPTRKYSEDAGIDLYCVGTYNIKPGESKIIKTGVSVNIPKGFFGLIKAKSKNNFIVGAGVVDQNYQGELLIKIINYHIDNKRLIIINGTGVAQLLLIPTIYPEIEEVHINELYGKESDRKDSGGIVSQLIMELGYD